MPRVRISTTVDAESLAACRRLTAAPDSQMFDRALAALIEEMEGAAENAALDAHPYDADPDLGGTAGEGPPLPYDGKVPPEILARARARRRRA